MPVIVAIVLITFVVRDGQLIASSGPIGWPKRLSVYAATFAMQAAAALVLFHANGADELTIHVRSTAIWLPSIALHIAIWFHVQHLRKAPEPVAAWTAAVLPSPVLFLSIILTVLYLRDTLRAIPTLALLAGIVGVWVMVVAAFSRIWMVAASADEESALEFSGMSNLLALFLVPFELL